ncbi:MAG: hypothetical protein RL226_1211 [Bacteroidota bacterium]|jgi:uncharacterized protein (TIGR00725 family)
MRKKQVTVIGRYDATPEQYQLGIGIGKLLADLGIIAITGGRAGLMEAVAKGCTDAGGISVGILPGDHFEDGNPYNTISIPTGIGYARNSMNVLAADVVIAVGGASGTLSEMAFAWSYKRTIIAFVGSGGWADELAGKTIDHRNDQPVIPVHSLDELRHILIKELDL